MPEPCLPLVSIVTPAFNAADTIGPCIASVAGQTHADWEHLVADDGSTDATAAIAEAAAMQDARVRLLRAEANGGAAVARNRALATARGRFVAFLDADDLWLPRKLETQLTAIADQGAALSYGSYYVTPRIGAAPQRFFLPPAQLSYAELLQGCPIGCSTVMIDRDAAGAIVMPGMRRGQDWALWLSLARRGLRMASFPGIHTVYTERPGSLSSNKLRKLADVMRVYRASEGLDAVRSGRLLAQHALYVVWRKRHGFHDVEPAHLPEG